MNSIKMEYLYSLINNTDDDCDQMKALRQKYPDIAYRVVHMVYCSRDKISWLECKECQFRS